MKAFIFTGACTAGALYIGYHWGYDNCEKKLTPQVNELRTRIQYLEQGIVKPRTNH